MNARHSSALVGLLLMILAGTVLAATADPPLIEGEVQRIALFKNGLGYFETTATVPAGESAFRFRPIGAATHGSYWLSWPQSLPLQIVTAHEVEDTRQRPAATPYELCKANVGAKVCIHLDDDQAVSGVIEQILEPDRPEPPRPYDSGRHYNENNSPRNWPIGSGSVLVREFPESLIVVEGARIRRVDFQAEEIKNTIPQGGMAAELRVELAASSGSSQTVTAHYLAKGVTWAPSYQVDISVPTQAILSAKAMVLNEIADMDAVEVILVTGYPHLQFSDITSPFFLKQDLAAFLNTLSQGRDERHGDMMMNVMRQSAFPAPGMGGGFGGPMPDYGAAQSGLQAEDLFLYPAGTLNIERDAVAYVPLFSEPVPYEHVYTWDIPDYLVETRGYQVRGERRADEQSQQIVWHVLRLENTTDLPWTTAPAATVKDGMILGQDTLTYTALGMKRDLRITQAVNVIAEEAEREVSRERDAMNLYGRHFDQATIEGQLSVTNRQTQSITLEITKTLSGEVLNTNPSAQIDQPGKGLLELNSLRILKWQLNLNPHQTKEISYKYQLYVPR